jgi:hypothetical protein
MHCTELALVIKDIENPILYSTMSLVAYNVNRLYYKGLHYVWCTPYFSSNFDSPHYTVPPSSSPFEIYKQMQNEIKGADRHGVKIRLNRLGIRKGAEAMHHRGIITESILTEISLIAKTADLGQFRPLLCVISRLEAVPYYKTVAIGKKANPMSQEFILADLPQSASML